MAAIYSGIHLKLKSPQTAWEDKLKLARFAWISSQCLLPNKEQVLLDWCTHALTGWYSQKVEFSYHVLEGLWCYLDDLLHSQKLQSLLKQGKSISLRHMAQLLLDRLQECASDGKEPQVNVSILLSVLQGILSLPGLSSVFTTKYEVMVDLLAKLCTLARRELQQPLLTSSLQTSTQAQRRTAPDTSKDQLLSGCLPIQHAGDCKIALLEPFTTPQDPPLVDAEKLPSKPKEISSSAYLFEMLFRVLLCYLSVQRQQANLHRVFTLVANQLLQPVVLLRHLLVSGENAASHSNLQLRQRLCRDICTKMDTILQSALFPPEYLSSYKEELLPSKEDCGKRGHGGAKGVLTPASTVLCKLSAIICEPHLCYSVKSDSSSLLFKFFLDSYGKGRDGEEQQRMLCFYFFTRLVAILDVGCGDQEVSLSSGLMSPSVSHSSPESWNVALLAVEALLSQALSADIYNVAADRIRHGDVQLNFYRSLGQMLFNQAQPSIPAWYRCLRMLLSLNHLILEPDLDQLLSSAWVNAECMEGHVQQDRQLLICSLFQTYTKLRQLPRLFSELLCVICQPALDDLRPPLLTESVSSSLRTYLLDTPSSQALEICSLVLESIRKYILPELLQEEKEAEGMQMVVRGGEMGEKEGVKKDEERGDASIKLFTLSQLLHAVLFSVKTLDDASPLPLVRQTHSLMEEMQQVIMELHQMLSAESTGSNGGKTNSSSFQRTTKRGKRSLQNTEPQMDSDFTTGLLWKQKTQEAALLLRYTWVEVDTLIHIHCSKYTSCDAAQTAAAGELGHPDRTSAPVVTSREALLSSEIFPDLQHCAISSTRSPISCFLLKLLTLQQIKKMLLDTPLLDDPKITALLTRAAKFVLAKDKLEVTVDRKHVWDGQIGSLSDSSYHVAHWYLITSNLPLIAPYLTGEDVGCAADVLVSSLLDRKTNGVNKQPPGYMSVSLISAQLLQGLFFTELPLLFSATVQLITQRIIEVLVSARAPQTCSTIKMFQKAVKARSSQLLPTLVKTEVVVGDILRFSKTGDASVLLTDIQTEELLNLLNILNLNPDGLSSEDLSSLFLLLFFILTSTSSKPDSVTKSVPESTNDALFLQKLFRCVTYFLEGKNFHGVLTHIYGSSLLQAAVSSLLSRIGNRRFGATCITEWLELIEAVQDFIRSLVQLIIIRNNSVLLNLEQFATFLSSDKMANKQIGVHSSEEATSSGKTSSQEAVLSVQLLLASLSSFSEALISNLGRSKALDKTLMQILARSSAAMGPIMKSALEPQVAHHSAHSIGQAFVVRVVTIMLQCELSSMSSEGESTSKVTKLALNYLTLYRGICHQVLKEMCSACRPMDFLVSSLHFLSAFYKAVERMGGAREQEESTGGKELDELYIHILQNVHRLLIADWLSPDDVCELEPPVQDLFHHLVGRSTTSQFNLLLMMIAEGLDICKMRAGNYREALSAVIIIKLLSYCQLPEPCSKALWLTAPQAISAMVFLVRSSSQDVSLTIPFTIPTIISMTSLLRQGQGLISNPHHVLLVLGALQLVPLDCSTPLLYQSAFQAVHEALFAIIQCHRQVMLEAAPSFLNVFYRLVTSIMQEGRQRGDIDTHARSQTGVDGDVYLQCARLVERMYSHIAATVESFTTLSAFMVAQYVTELQKVTLRPDIKVHLTEGIYCMLDLCKEQDVKFLMAGLQMGVREVFNELYSSYTHYHKAQRQGEEKYTV
ncbi:unhealthy ribosome biogenesis protein 2 homolog [Thalassophryne amazonica]|uniref:unhealthy ribosome biogenesis protein 2 homolog n=1 Tax=Thalassophryne amazonica TaxID=390379 RepID=UPI0014725E6D|nr:unhealthy ribosome biogenesis protein 2 homolog [Thalassophryne amazonica]